MARIYTIGGKQIDIDDTTAIQMLSHDEFTELFDLVMDSASFDDEHAVPSVHVDREPGTGFVIAPQTDKGDARCECDVEGCHCDGIADLAEMGFTRCACCVADCPDVHDDPPFR